MEFVLREEAPGCVVLQCNGGLSWEARDHLAASVEQYVQRRESFRGLVIDMASVEYVNSAGVGALFQVEQCVRAAGGCLTFAGTMPTIQRLLDTVGMQRMANFAGDVPTAMTCLDERKSSQTPVGAKR